MSFQGMQTIEFLGRSQKFAAELPPLLVEMTDLLKGMIAEIEQPQLEDIQRMQAEMRRLIGDPQRLEDICGQEGKLCKQCPFGAYLPSGFPFSSSRQPLCLPWIVVTQPAGGGRVSPENNPK